MPWTGNKIIQLSQTDEEIVESIKLGAVQDFRLLVKKYNQRLFRLTVSFGINNFDAEDVIQRAYISAYRKLDQFKGDAKFSTWLTKIVINECLMYKRTQKNQRGRSEDILNDFSSKHELYSGQNPEESYMKDELKKILEDTIRMIPEKYRAVYVIREIEGLSTKETAEVLSISEENVKIRLFRAKELLKDHLLTNFDKKELLSFGNERCDRVTDNVMNIILKEQSA